MTQTMEFFGPTFTIQIPSDWFVGASAQFQAVFTSVEERNGFRPNAAISVRPVQEDVTVEAVLEAARVTQQNEYQDYQLIDESEQDRDGIVFLHQVYQWHMVDEDESVYQQQLFCIYEQRLYTLTATRLVSDPQAKKIDSIFEKMVSTFAFKDTAV